MTMGANLLAPGLSLLLTFVAGCGALRRSSEGVGGARPDPVRAAALNEQGLRLVQDDRFDEAEKVFREALDADPFFGPAHCNLGTALLKLGRPYDAAWALQAAAKLMPRAAEPRANLGVLFEAAGQYDKAEEELREALKLAPDDIEVIGQLARIHVRAGKKTPETIAWLQTVAARDDDPQWRNWARLELTRCDPIPFSDARELP